MLAAIHARLMFRMERSMPRSFNGTSDLIHVDSAHLTNGATAFSIAGWVKSAATAFAMIYAETEPPSAGPLFFFSLSGSSPHTTGAQLEIEARSLSTGGVDEFQNTATVADSTWHHVAVTQNASSLMTLYADGIADGTKTRTSLSNFNSQSFRAATIGAQTRSSTTNFFPGLVAHLASWTRQLSAREVLSLASGLLPPALGPAHYWPLWGVDSPEPDLVSVGTDGTLTGTAKGAGGPRVGLSMLRLAA